ncbi:MAG: DUF2971 domain-containing protein [Rhizobiaceae bacterium]|nr:DUF2971 domain-containing protein [Rhizobiaceae bacterium]
MNDFMEIEHGASCLANAWRSKTGDRFKALVEGMFEGVADELAKLVDGWVPSFRADTFITCLSEHDDGEDDLGRLSMWRAYGGSSGVAVVLNPTVFLGTSDALPALTSPVSYLSHAAFEHEFGKVTDNIAANRDGLLRDGRQELINRLFHCFRLAVLCTKHQGFAEEREWRIVYAPMLHNSDRIEASVQLINGVPQIVHSIPFKDYPDEGLVGAELSKLINRVIIGPTEFPSQLRLAMVSLLTEAGVTNAVDKVVCSTIPLRQ